jgi:hypothetical protein
MRRTLLATTLLLLTGCGASYEAQSTITGVRILGVKKDTPYAAPGDTVKFRMLLHDGAESPRKVNVQWLGGCENPPGDLYAGCLAGLTADGGTPKTLFDLFPNQGNGFEFSYTLTKDIISRRPSQGDKVKTPYGVSYVFFAACTGHFDKAPSDETFPVACFDDTGARVGSDGFIVGYSQIFAYQDFRNGNPVVTGFQVDGHALDDNAALGSPIECIGDDCIGIEQTEFGVPTSGPVPDGGLIPVSDGGLIPVSDGGAPQMPTEPAPAGPGGDGTPLCDINQPWCIERCTKDRLDDCPKHTVKVLLDQDLTSETDGVASEREGRTIFEQQWVNYYVDEGKLDGEIKLLQDATSGWRDKHETKVFAPQTNGPFHVWAVAHDNRGGMEWIRTRLVVTEPLPKE